MNLQGGHPSSGCSSPCNSVRILVQKLSGSQPSLEEAACDIEVESLEAEVISFVDEEGEERYIGR